MRRTVRTLSDRLKLGVLVTVTSLSLSACNETESSFTTGALSGRTSSTTTGGSSSVASGTKAVRVLFRQSSTTGSFDSPGSTGTTNAVGSGLAAKRLFNPDNSLLVEGDATTSTWPKWLTNVEIGISGTANTAATDADCARFATSTDASAVCDYNADGTFDVPCGAPEGLFRVSEKNCTAATTGTGGPTDGVYIRATFNRDTQYLGNAENILVVVEYAASGVNRTPSVPTSCFSGGVFTPTSSDCADQSWQAYLKSSASELAQPFLLFIPPIQGFVDSANNRSGSGVSTRQFILPLSGNTNLKVFQLSRIQSLPAASFPAICSDNSPLCVGVIFYSITFYRM